MRVQRRLRRQGKCAHRSTVSVQSSGVERVVCETCGHVSVHFVADLAGEVERDRFARPVERVEGKHLVPDIGLFDDEFDAE
jgi:hypothetical protein